MRRQLAAAVLLLFAATARGQTTSSAKGAVDWIFVVDTSKSMVQNEVFDDVKSSLGTFIREAADQDTVTILTFDRDVSLRTPAVSAGGREDLLRIVDELSAKGDRTHLGKAIAAGLARHRPQPDRTSAVVLFTDGKEDVRGITNPVQIPSTFTQARDSGAYMFFVSMKEHEEQLRTYPNARFIAATDEQAIRGVAEEIREIVEPAPTLPPLAFTVRPGSFTLGDVERGTTHEREVTIESNRPAEAAVGLVDTAGVSMQPQTVKTPARVTLRFTIAEDAEPGPRRLTITAAGQAIPATLTVLTPSPWIEAAKWAALAAAIAALAFAARSFLKSRNRLEGEIEVVKPHAAYVGLPSLRSDEIALSSILPLDALAGSDARLFCRHKDGDKKVWIASTAGSLRVNDVELPTTELFDADTIQIGNAKLRFNRVGYDRPQENL